MEFIAFVLVMAPWLIGLWLGITVFRAWRRRNVQLERMERRLDELDRRVGPGPG